MDEACGRPPAAMSARFQEGGKKRGSEGRGVQNLVQKIIIVAGGGQVG